LTVIEFLIIILFCKDSNIIGIRLDSDPEDRDFYVNCPECGKLNLDKGLHKELM